LFGLPHLAAARALLLLGLVGFLSPSPAAESKRRGVMAGLALIGVWLFQPLTVIVAWAVMAAFLALIFLRNRFRREPSSASLRDASIRALIAAAMTIPPMLYSALSFAFDPVLRQWAAQNILPSAPIWEYALSYSVLLLPALAGAWLALREDDRWLLPIGWMLVVPVLIYLPLTVQRRLAEGFWMALVVLTLFFVERTLRGLPRRAAFVAGMTLLLPAAVLFWGLALSRSLSPAAPSFLPAEEVRAFEWLDLHAERDAVVLSPYDAGNALPAYSDLQSFIGHGPETLNSGQKQILVETVLDGGRTDAERLAALRQTGARYILIGPVERSRMGAGVPGCELIYREGGWEIWRVIPEMI